MCREHALMTAGLGALLGFRAYLAWGKLALVGDEEGVSAKRMMSVSDPHSWTMFEGIGVYDLSPNLTQAAEIKWNRLEIQALPHQPNDNETWSLGTKSRTFGGRSSV